MNEKLTDIAERRKKLILQAATQRSILKQQIVPLRQPLAIADRGLAIIGYFKHNPLLVASTTALLSMIRPLRYSKWFNVGWMAFKLVRNVWRK